MQVAWALLLTTQPQIDLRLMVGSSGVSFLFKALASKLPTLCWKSPFSAPSLDFWFLNYMLVDVFPRVSEMKWVS